MLDWINFALYVKPTLKVNACGDYYDNAVLECALTSNADFVVTGDTDLLVLHSFKKNPIITPVYFVRDILKILC
jgi:predicted nucleic acid-binding protein